MKTKNEIVSYMTSVMMENVDNQTGELLLTQIAEHTANHFNEDVSTLYLNCALFVEQKLYAN